MLLLLRLKSILLAEKDLNLVEYIEGACKCTLPPTHYSALVSELTISELDQLLASDIQSQHKAYLKEQKEDRESRQAALSLLECSNVSVFTYTPEQRHENGQAFAKRNKTEPRV